MKKRILFLVIYLSFLLSSEAQTKWGIKAGVNINNQSGFSGAQKKSLITGQASFNGVIFLDKSFILQPSIGYYPKGSRLANMTFEDQLGNPIGTGTLSYRFDYIELAAPFQYLIANNKTKLFSGLGPYLSYAIGGKEIWKNISGTPSNEPIKREISFGSNGSKRFDAGFVAALSAIIQNKWMPSIHYEIGIVNTYYSSQNKVNNRSGGVTIGYFFK